MSDPLTIAELQSGIEARFRAISEVSPRSDGTEFVPAEGWHTIRVGGIRADCDAATLRLWLRLFNLYAKERPGAGLFWRDVPHLDREKRELIGVFCIQ